MLEGYNKSPQRPIEDSSIVRRQSCMLKSLVSIVSRKALVADLRPAVGVTTANLMMLTTPTLPIFFSSDCKMNHEDIQACENENERDRDLVP